ncbi:hypothetical protein TD95_000121 [Thielaviopsis punctulata]|uniref:Choline kinase N-terminal domain-containing protein n=1 Tax=Thielaviopsis punctulata TaxID=72032 RepID=A0A0F4Z7Y4_9PEZI|nr:hypothetical protein TD95_000121 [Thielaviopsis punctulata]
MSPPGAGAMVGESPALAHSTCISAGQSLDDATTAAVVAAASSVVNGGSQQVSSPHGTTTTTTNAAAATATHGAKTPQSHRHRVPKTTERLLAQVAEWLEHEKAKAERRKKAAHVPRRRSPRSSNDTLTAPDEEHSSVTPTNSNYDVSSSALTRQRSSSVDSQASDDVSLDRLQRIIEDNVSALGLSQVPAFTPRLGCRPSRRRILVRTNSSDTEYVDGDVIVPSCDGSLDVSKTLAYSGGAATTTTPSTSAVEGMPSLSKHKEKERQAWSSFKTEIIRLTHTLKLKGWRRVPLENADSITVERISGALTNSVYMVSPPANINQLPAVASPTITPLRKPPPKLLLRVYGPQVEALIDRETELAVLRRLSRKKIGPRLLGTFENGRFEEFFNAITLRPQNLREPETSRQIAKRMRELHLGIDLLPAERLGGPAVFNNWDKWQDTVERIITALDSRYEAFKESGAETTKLAPSDAWMSHGYVCGVKWPFFRDMVRKHREYVQQAYGSKERLQETLVFCHNDTQYGNILRIEPDNQKSPLLQPANKHKQLVVIDFEYAAANVPGLDIVNHFTEWAYNYHDPAAPHKCLTHVYPTREEQMRFIRAYVEHRPEFPHSGSTPRLTPLDSLPNTPYLGPASSSASIVDFMLDARSAASGALTSASKEDLSLTTRDEETENRVKELADEALLWRAANSAQWVAWGIVQAKVPTEGEDEKAIKREGEGEGGEGEGEREGEVEREGDGEGEGEEEEEEQFDYLGYARERAMFFWGDCVMLGLVKKEELPEALQKRIKIVRN